MVKATGLIVIIAVAAVIGLSMAACDNPSAGDSGGANGGGNAPATSGSLTITGLGGYNGKYVIADGIELKAAADAALDGKTITGGKVAGDMVTLKVWDAKSGKPLSYSGNDTVSFWVEIYGDETIKYDDSKPVAEGYVENVTFTNGKGAGAFQKDY
jgi:hypothetical protein